MAVITRLGQGGTVLHRLLVRHAHMSMDPVIVWKLRLAVREEEDWRPSEQIELHADGGFWTGSTFGDLPHFVLVPSVRLQPGVVQMLLDEANESRIAVAAIHAGCARSFHMSGQRVRDTWIRGHIEGARAVPQCPNKTSLSKPLSHDKGTTCMSLKHRFLHRIRRNFEEDEISGPPL